MNVTERGIYRELLDECWAEGSLPPDLDDLAEIARCTRAEMESAWPTLQKSFSERPDGRWVNDKIARVLLAQTEAIARQVDAGRKGGKKRAQNAAKTREILKGALSTLQVPSSIRVDDNTTLNNGQAAGDPGGPPPVLATFDRWGKPQSFTIAEPICPPTPEQLAVIRAALGRNATPAPKVPPNHPEVAP